MVVQNLTVAEALERLRVSRVTLYKLIDGRELASFTIGRRRFIPAAAIDA